LGRCCKEQKLDSCAEELFQWSYNYINTFSENQFLSDPWMRWMKSFMEGEGLGTIKNEESAFEGNLKVAATGHVLGYFSIALAYEYGRGITKDLTKAFEWYEKASEMGLNVAMCNIGCLYYKGKGVPADMEESFRWYTKAAQAGHGPSQEWLRGNQRAW